MAISKENWLLFFTNKSHPILTVEEFEQIYNYCSFSMAMPTIEKPYVLLKISTSEVLPQTIYSKLLSNKIPNLKIELISANTSTDYSKIYDYIDQFVKANYPNSFSLKQILERENLSVDVENKALLVKYVLPVQVTEVRKIEKEILFFLNKANFAITKIDMVLDQEKQNKMLEMENAKRKYLEEVKKTMSKQDNPMAKYEKMFNVDERNITPLSVINDQMIDAKLNVQGEIISAVKTENKHVPGKVRYEFVIFDYEMGAINMIASYTPEDQNKKNKFFKYRPKMPVGYLDTFVPGNWIRAHVSILADPKAPSRMFIYANKMCHIPTPKKFLVEDNATTKRVELLAHTNYSAFNGLDKPEDVYNFAYKLGYKALATVDRYNVQAFPDIVNHFDSKLKDKAGDIKHIYGSEFQVIEKMIPAVVNPKGQDLSTAKYVIFDIETTGLYPEFEDLIEFGAIKWENGMIIDHCDMFVKPTKPLTNVAINMSHITNDMVENGLKPKEALLKIKEYIGDAILVAHNGIRFDLNFLNKLCEKYNVEPITNTLIDTLELSHSINWDSSRHNLGTLTRKLHIEYNELVAHRADKDSEYLMHVFKWFLSYLIKEKITNVDQINDYLQNAALKANRRGYFVDIYAKNQQGLKDLYKLVSLSSTKQLFTRDQDRDQQSIELGVAKLFWEDIEQYRENLIVCPHPLDGEIWDGALNDTDATFIKKIKKYDFIFVAPVKNYSHLVVHEEITKNNIVKALKRIIEFSRAQNKQICAVSDAYYCLPWKHDIYKIYVYQQQIGGKRHPLFRHDGKIEIPDYHFMTTQEMLDAFKFVGNEQLINEIVIDNTIKFADQIQKVQPIKKLKNGKTPYSPHIDNCEKLLTDLVWSNAHKIWGETIPQDVVDRTNRELNAIIGNEYAVIYWLSHLLVKKSVEDGYLVGSRGSVGSSLVAFLANISEVNPLPPHYICKHCHHYEPYEDTGVDGFDLPAKKCPVCGQEMYRDGHNIPFESFMGQNCDKIPDIDLNFSGEYQAKAHNFIKEMLGPEHAFRAGTIATVADRTAYGYVKKYFELTEPNIAKPDALIAALAAKAAGVKRTTGQHPGGIVVVAQNDSIEDYCPCSYPSDNRLNSWYTTHFDYHQMNEVLLKFDILGHDEPTILNHLERLTGIDPRTIPNFDPKVMKLFEDSSTIGIIDEHYDINTMATFALPEFGTANTRRIVEATKPKGFGDLVKISGLSHGTNVWQNNAEVLIKKNGCSIGQVVCCREDIIQYLTTNGVDFKTAFAATEKIRKGKGLPPENEATMVKAKVPMWYIDSCKKIQYLFPKAHATAYVLDAIRTAWYKVYYPVQFYAVWLSIRTDKAFDIATIIKGKDAVEAKYKELKQREKVKNKPELALTVKEEDLIPILEVCLEMFARGINVKNIDINKSQALDFVIEGNDVIAPFVALDGLGAEAAKSIVEARKQKPFSSISDLTRRTKLSTTLIQKLKDLHVLDKLDEDEQMRLF